MTPFDPSTTQLTSFEKRYDQDGKVFIQAVAHGALTAKTPYWVIINEYGQVTVALSDLAIRAYVAFPLAAVSSGATAWLQIGGYIADIVTPSLSVAVGHGLTLNTGAIADIGADYTGAAGEFAACAVASTTATTQTVILVPERVLSIT